MHEQRVQAVDELVDSRFDWAHAFHEFGRVLPPGQVSLTSLTGTIGGSSGGSTAAGADTAAGAAAKPPPRPARATTAGASVSRSRRVELERDLGDAAPAASPPSRSAGCATSQSMVALTLDRLRLIDGVSEVTLQSSTQASKAAGGSSTVAAAAARGHVHDADHLRPAAERFRDELAEHDADRDSRAR